MILNVVIGSGGRGLLSYISSQSKTGKDNQKPFFTNMAGLTVRELSKEISALRQQRPNLKKAIAHVILSHDPTDRLLSDDEWRHAISVALKEHAAEDAVFAAYTHQDTRHQHAHLFFLRITTSNNVISDSHNFRKNKTAARRIEKELKLNSPSEQPNPIASGNRKALQNASRRGERLGIPAISAQTLRDAIGSATSRSNLSHLLGEKNIETEFQTRGKKDEIYGYKVKIKGTDEWISASTLGKDLSWPKIAHRFKNDQLEADPASKMPQALKSILLPEHFGTKEIKPHAALQTEVTLSTEKFNNQIVNLNLGPASTAMLLIAGALAKASLSLVNMVIAFLKLLMAFFGFGMRQTTYQVHEHPDASAPALCYEPAPLALPAPKSAEDKAAMELYQVARALEENDATLLPVLDDPEAAKARANLVAAMEEQIGKGIGASTTDAEKFDLGITDEDFTSTNSVAEQPIADPMVELKEALAAHEIAARQLELAKIKNGPIHFSTVDQRKKELIIVREDLESARSKWDEFCIAHPMSRRLPSAEKTRLRQVLENNEKAEKCALQAVATAEAEDLRIKILYATLPAAIVPLAILQAEAQTRQAFKTAREAIQAEALEAIRSVRSDIMMSPKMAKFESAMELSFKQFNRTGKVSEDELKILNSHVSELRRLKSAQEAARRAAMAEFDGNADKPASDGQIVK